ncbi:MAG: dihydroorotate dehydrogenase electron transfer subunit [Calditrichaeota bacterium]|nr:dihydroorotate dehydrogenase electron transfer subunit [Calditrichota bacterium]
MPALHACLVTCNEQVSQTVFRLTLHAPDLALAAAPGQFVNIRIQEGAVPLWRRPLSVYSANRDAGSLRLLFEVRGVGTRILAASRPGTTLDVLGPLGTAFLAPPRGALPVLVAGGLGIAPLHFWAEELARAGCRPLLLFGARTAEALCALDDLRRLDSDLRLATEDGTEGMQGMVTELLATTLAEQPPQQTMVYACGPVPMLREVERICAARAVDGQICLETLMACGFGACMGCAVAARSSSPQPGYKLVCKDGPVFNFGEVDLER